MRTNEDMLRAVHQRADRMRRDGQKRRRLWMGGGAAAGALAIVILLAVRMPSLTEGLVSVRTNTMQASMLTESGALGYAVTGVVAFLLGAAVTVFCFTLRSRRGGEKNDHDRDR